MRETAEGMAQRAESKDSRVKGFIIEEIASEEGKTQRCYPGCPETCQEGEAQRGNTSHYPISSTPISKIFSFPATFLTSSVKPLLLNRA